jgi:hypothetical protein
MGKSTKQKRERMRKSVCLC